MNTNLNQKNLLNIQEASEFLNIKISRLRTAIFKNEVPYLKIGRLVRFDPSDLTEWIQEKKEESKPSGFWL
ncbi:helix-turn-helix domain-containing protein [Halobacteriovorax marinus]|uniref:helix-turn-helix domain-containing protein n=1 Tax=Halobacteriovorax marinus TaxID=97084 RepID=UPI003A8F9AC8